MRGGGAGEDLISLLCGRMVHKLGCIVEGVIKLEHRAAQCSETTDIESLH